jgi:hypothetical protein
MQNGQELRGPVPPEPGFYIGSSRLPLEPCLLSRAVVSEVQSAIPALTPLPQREPIRINLTRKEPLIDHFKTNYKETRPEAAPRHQVAETKGEGGQVEEGERVLAGGGQEEHQGLPGPGAAGSPREVRAGHRPEEAGRTGEGAADNVSHA